jgi:hypothetical protein
VRQAVEYETTLANITELEEALALAQEQVCGLGLHYLFGRAGVCVCVGGGGEGGGHWDGVGCACAESA